MYSISNINFGQSLVTGPTQQATSRESINMTYGLLGDLLQGARNECCISWHQPSQGSGWWWWWWVGGPEHRINHPKHPMERAAQDCLRSIWYPPGRRHSTSAVREHSGGTWSVKEKG